MVVLRRAAIGIIGATVMPHSLFLGSALATQDRVSSRPPANRVDEDANEQGLDQSSTDNARSTRTVLMGFANSARDALRIRKLAQNPDAPKTHADWINRPLSFVRAHLYHGIVDMVVSLLGLAVVINAM